MILLGAVTGTSKRCVLKVATSRVGNLPHGGECWDTGPSSSKMWCVFVYSIPINLLEGIQDFILNSLSSSEPTYSFSTFYFPANLFWQKVWGLACPLIMDAHSFIKAKGEPFPGLWTNHMEHYFKRILGFLLRKRPHLRSSNVWVLVCLQKKFHSYGLRIQLSF